MAIDLTKGYANITIDVALCEIRDDFWAKQGDTGRGFVVSLVENSMPVTPNGELVQLHIKKPDGKQSWIQGEVVGNDFVINLTNQSLFASGKAMAEILISSRGKTKRTETFIIDIIPNLADGSYESQNEFSGLEIMITKIEQYAPLVEAWEVNENERIADEIVRDASEITRVSNEQGRVTADAGRTTLESGRVTAEGIRGTNETTRANAESGRSSNETTRQTQEGVRQSNEGVREAQEALRQSNTTLALGEMELAVDTTVLVWKEKVPTYADIATTYPNPEVGWRVEVASNNAIYRYDGIATWVHVSNNSASSDAELKQNKNTPNGYAGLDGAGMVLLTALPEMDYAGTEHIHTYAGAISDITNTNLNPEIVPITDVNGKITNSSVSIVELGHLSGATSNLQTQINGKTPLIHEHTMSNIEGLDTALGNKANSAHGHAITDVTGLNVALSGKAESIHGHAISDTVGLADAINSKQPTLTGAATTIATSNLDPLTVPISDASGKITSSSVTTDELGTLAGMDRSIFYALEQKVEDDHWHQGGVFATSYEENLSNGTRDFRKSVVVNGDANLYYPVLFNAETDWNNVSEIRFDISRPYNFPAPDTWYTSTHKGGLTLSFYWTGRGGWSGNYSGFKILEFRENYSTMVAGMASPVSGGIIVWLRGGGAEYTFQTEYMLATSIPIVYLDTYTAPDGATFPVRSSISARDNEMTSRTLPDLSQVYPVGSIYMNVNSTNPAQLFGGVWTQLQNQFLLGAGTSYTNGTTGGAATVALSEANLPSHTHSITHDHASFTSGGHSADHSHSYSGTTGNDNTEHTHGVVGSSAGIDTNHTHTVPANSGTANSAGSHGHGVRYKRFDITPSTNAAHYYVLRRNDGADSYDGTDSDAAVAEGAHTHGVSVNAVETGTVSSGHAHSISITSAGRSAYHQHTWSGNTAGASVGHTHSIDVPSFSGTSGGTGSSTAHNNLPPYLVVYMWVRMS